jgi:hypothetical protein
MHRKHVLLPSREPIFACECLLFFRCPRLRIRGFRVCTRASRATSFIISAAVIWYTVLFRQNRTDRPVGAIIHDGRVKACRIAGVFLVDRMSATEFGKKHEAQAQADAARKARSERLAKLLISAEASKVC